MRLQRRWHALGHGPAQSSARALCLAAALGKIQCVLYFSLENALREGLGLEMTDEKLERIIGNIRAT
jgi:hypothetical protein